MNIIVATAEATPFAKTGGLADIASALPLDWAKFAQSPIVVMPKYKSIDTEKYGFRPTDMALYVPMGHWTEFARLWEGYLPGSDVPAYLIENNDYYNRDGIYGGPDEYGDNDRRFIFLSRAIFETAKALGFKPDIIHSHDYHTAFSQAFLKSHYRYDPLFSNAAGVLTIHNLAHQGWFQPDKAMHYATFGMKEFYPGCWFEKNGAVNAMKAGIMFADKITTVSPTYAQEIRTPWNGEGLMGALNLRGADLVGILNGAYYDEWSPENDLNIYEKYGPESLEKKEVNKNKFISEHGIGEDDDPDLPLIGMVSRLTEQKGIDILMNILEKHLEENKFRFALLGAGEWHYEEYFKYLKEKYPKLALIQLGYSQEQSHKIIAASDFFFVPSRFEPCGLTQMYALKYGSVPIVRSTGGLADTVQEYIPDTGEGTGFVFWRYNGDDFAYAIRRALSIYKENGHWDLARKNGMAQDNSSSRSAMEYLRVFKWALEKVRGPFYGD